MSKEYDLFIGITTSNSNMFLPYCLKAIYNTTKNITKRIVVLDNYSKDNTVSIAHNFGVEVNIQPYNQPDALNALYNKSSAMYTLLIHADTILLSDQWFELCRSKMSDDVTLVSPEDIGCGPYSRPFGTGMPESSFLFFNTHKMKRARIIRIMRYFRLPIPRWVIDFYGEHVTHSLPKRISQMGLSWYAMNVHISELVKLPIYRPHVEPIPFNWVWTEELGHLRYGLGNFYSIDGIITHYHNWFERISLQDNLDPLSTTNPDNRGFPIEFIKIYTMAFISDYSNSRLVIPEAVKTDRKPVYL
jgi:glycosyltransferase involved in cell wall biosynthesis